MLIPSYLKIPLKKGEFSASYERFIPRNEMDIAVAAVASSLELSNGKVSSCRVALAAVGPTPIFAKEASELLVFTNVNLYNNSIIICLLSSTGR